MTEERKERSSHIILPRIISAYVTTDIFTYVCYKERAIKQFWRINVLGRTFLRQKLNILEAVFDKIHP